VRKTARRLYVLGQVGTSPGYADRLVKIPLLAAEVFLLTRGGVGPFALDALFKPAKQ